MQGMSLLQLVVDGRGEGRDLEGRGCDDNHMECYVEKPLANEGQSIVGDCQSNGKEGVGHNVCGREEGDD